MPELAEVELARRIWGPATGQKIIALESHPKTRVYRDTPARELQKQLVGKAMVISRSPVSYTHLTLPTIYSV